MSEEHFESLSEFIGKTREKAGFSVSGLSKRSGIPVEQLEDIEAGKDLFLPATVRQKLAKALKLNPADIKVYERVMIDSYDRVTSDYIKAMKEAILNGETDNLRCPICSSKLITKVVRLVDLNNEIALHPKAQCSKCTFQIK